MYFLVLMLSCTGVDASAQSVDVYYDALHVLTEEAQQVLQSGEFEHNKPDFAGRFEQEISHELLSQRIVRSVHRDVFIDGYVRWQLTSFRFQLPQMNDRRFERMVNDLPKLHENPWSNRAAINRMMAISAAGGVPESKRESIEQELAEVRRRADRAAALNRPAIEFRVWIERQSRDNTERRLVLAMERCESLIRAGWPIDREKSALDELFTQAAEDDDFSKDQRQEVMKQARKLIGVRKLHVRNARLEGGTLAVESAEAAIYDFDVNRWARMLMRESE